MKLLKQLNSYAEELAQEFDQIPADRKKLLAKLADYTRSRLAEGKPALLNFICTHNSRRSHLSQIWAQTAAAFYNLNGVQCFSGGTEATAFNPRAVQAMGGAGFRIDVLEPGENPLYAVHFAEGAPAVKAWSKRFDDAANPTAEICAVMTCSDADQNCPLVPGAALRLPVTYDDPKKFDGTALEAQMYSERVRQIGREMLYAFSLV